MELPDASLELVFSAEALPPRFKTVAALSAAGAALLALAAPAATGTAFCATAALTGGVFADRFPAVPASARALLFTVVLPGLAMVFVVAVAVFGVGASVFVIVFASLPGTVFNKDFAADLPVARVFDATAAPPAIFFAALFTLAFLVADLVTVAFIFILFLS